jgi:hypothetical protein
MENARIRGRYTALLWILMGGCAVLALATKPLVRWASPDLAVSAAHRTGYVFFSNFAAGEVSSGRDPWGQPWRWREVDTAEAGNWYTGDKRFYALYSSGPNGVDEALAGDDVLLRSRPAAAAVDWSPEVFTGLALLALWLCYGPGVRRERSESRLGEAALIALIASFPVALSVLFLFWIQKQSWAVSLQESQPIVLSAPFAWYASAVAAWAIVATLLRFWIAPAREGEE